MPTTPPQRRRLVLVLLVAVTLVALVIGITAVVRATGDDTPPGAASTRVTTSATTSTPAASPTPSTASASSTALTGPPTGSRAPVAAPTPARSGITFGTALYALSHRDLERALDDVVTLRMRWIRIDLSWAAIQPLSASRYDWSAVDAVVSAARERRLRVLGLVTYTPPWARVRGCARFSCPPRRTSQFAAFAAAVVSRYASQGLRTYEIWNEPNITDFWRSPDPSAYGTLLRATVSAMRDATTADLQIHFGSLAFVADDAATRGGNIDAARFLRQACAARTCRVDAVGYDPYTYPRLPGDVGVPLNAWQRMANPAAGASGLKTAMTSVGLGRLSVWVTGFGAPSDYRGATDRRLVSEARQAAILRDGARLAGAARSVVGAYFVNTLRDDPSAGPLGGHFGLVRENGTRKPAFAALAAALKG